MGNIIEVISNFISITGNPDIDNILFAIVEVLSFSIAFGLIGMVFDKIGRYDSDIMSGAHWIVRIIVFLVISGLLYTIINFLKWIFSFDWWVYVLCLCLIIIVIIVIYIIKHKISQKKHLKKIENKTKEHISNSNEVKYCPRCGGTLVERFGPFGKFYGCSNYSKNNCRYTRNYK